MTDSNHVEEVFTEFQLTANVRLVSITGMTLVHYHVAKDYRGFYDDVIFMIHVISQVNQSIIQTGGQFWVCQGTDNSSKSSSTKKYLIGFLLEIGKILTR